MINVMKTQYNNHAIATAFHDTKSKNMVVFCHGYRGSSIGPNRFFVRMARKLEKEGISSLRFDQFGSGNSEGDFYDSSFDDWVATTKDIVEDYMGRGFQVALLGHSMGGAVAICTSAALQNVTSLVAWVPDPNVGEFREPETGFIEENGQRVQATYWQEAHAAHVAEKLSQVKAAAYLVQCSEDEYVDEQNRNAILKHALPQHKVEVLEGYSHSSWTYEQAEAIIDKSVMFIKGHFAH